MKAQELNLVAICSIFVGFLRNRNRAFHEQCYERSRIIIDVAKAFADEYEQGNRVSPVEMKVVHVVWHPPADNSIKVNVNASFSSTSSAAVYGVVAKGSRGDVKGCVVRRGIGKQSVLQCEL